MCKATFASTFFSLSFVVKTETWKTSKINWIMQQHGLILDLHYSYEYRSPVCSSLWSCNFCCVDLLSPFYFNLYNRKNTTDVLFDNDNDSYRAKCKHSVLKTALALEVYNCEGSQWLVHNLKTQKYWAWNY